MGRRSQAGAGVHSLHAGCSATQAWALLPGPWLTLPRLGVVCPGLRLLLRQPGHQSFPQTNLPGATGQAQGFPLAPSSPQTQRVGSAPTPAPCGAAKLCCRARLPPRKDRGCAKLLVRTEDKQDGREAGGVSCSQGERALPASLPFLSKAGDWRSRASPPLDSQPGEAPAGSAVTAVCRAGQLGRGHSGVSAGPCRSGRSLWPEQPRAPL